MTDATNDSHHERECAQGEARMDDATMILVDDLEALFNDEDEDGDDAKPTTPDPDPK
jgi:hypothetical protein